MLTLRTHVNFSLHPKPLFLAHLHPSLIGISREPAPPMEAVVQFGGSVTFAFAFIRFTRTHTSLRGD